MTKDRSNGDEGQADQGKESRGCFIPRHVLKDSELTMAQKVVYGRVESLSRKLGYCYASNGYLADELAISERQVSRHIGRLVSSGYLKRLLIRDSKGVVTERRLTPLQSPESSQEDTSDDTPQEPEDASDVSAPSDVSSRYGRKCLVEGRANSSTDVPPSEEIRGAGHAREQQQPQDREVELPQWANLAAGFDLDCQDCHEAASNPKEQREACEEHYIPTHERGLRAI